MFRYTYLSTKFLNHKFVIHTTHSVCVVYIMNHDSLNILNLNGCTVYKDSFFLLAVQVGIKIRTLT